MSTSTKVADLKINKLTKQQYEGITTPSNTELYFITDDSGLTSTDVTTALGYTPTQKATATNTALTASGGVCTWTVTHNMGTQEVGIHVYRVSDYAEIMCEKIATSTSVATIKFNSTSNISAGTYKVVILG